MAKERHREKERKRDRKGETLNHLSTHQWVRSAIFASHQLTSPIGFPFLKLPPPPCAVLLVFEEWWPSYCSSCGPQLLWGSLALRTTPPFTFASAASGCLIPAVAKADHRLQSQRVSRFSQLCSHPERVQRDWMWMVWFAVSPQQLHHLARLP